MVGPIEPIVFFYAKNLNIKNNIGNAEFAVAFLQKQISEMRKQMAQNIEKAKQQKIENDRQIMTLQAKRQASKNTLVLLNSLA